MSQASITITAAGDIAVNLASFKRDRRAENLSPRTIQSYGEACTQFHQFLAERGMPQEVRNITREHVTEFINDILSRWKPTTAANRFRGLQQFFKYLDEEGELPDGSPMARMKPPQIPEEPPDVVTMDEIRALIPDLSQAEIDSMDVGSYPQSSYYSDLMRVTEGLTDPDLAQTLVSQSYPTVLWLQQKGLRFVPMWSRQAFKIGDVFKFWGGLTLEAVGAGKGLSDQLFDVAQKLGIDVCYDTTARRLLQDRHGAISGLQALGPPPSAHPEPVEGPAGWGAGFLWGRLARMKHAAPAKLVSTITMNASV